MGGLAVGNVTANPATSGNSAGAGDIIVGSGVGTQAIAQVFNYSATAPAPHLHGRLTITPTFSSSVTGGISVAVADVNGDGVPDVVMGAGTNGGSLIDVWSGKTKTITSQFTAFTGAGNTAPVHVAIAKISTGVNDILAAQGIDGQSHDAQDVHRQRRRGRHRDGNQFLLGGRHQPGLISRSDLTARRGLTAQCSPSAGITA